ncbi:MAG TPA: phosphotransferase [Acidimicrobiales bacterium]|nr:phosphotransferase [Acidimicrobiales bacterium]
MNRALLRELGFELGARAEIGESDEGAWFATTMDGESVVLKWFPDEIVADRYGLLLPSLDTLRSRQVPVPEYPFVQSVDGWTLAAQRVLPGRPWQSVHGHGARIAPPQMIDRVVECVSAAAGVAGPPPTSSGGGWGEFMIHTLTTGEQGWAMHPSMRRWSPRSASLLERIEAVGSDADASWFPTNGLVHLDLHTGNLLARDDGTLTGVIDWEGACAGDHRFDLVTFAFDLDGAGQDIWELVDPLIEPHLLRAYVAHMSLKFTDWAIRHHPDDVDRQLARAERVLDRYGA